MEAVQTVKRERFKSVDFIRFIMAVFIVMFHMKDVFPAIKHLILGIGKMNICVDCFFIMSGFFLFNNINRDEDTLQFAKRRFFRLAPLLWLFILLEMFLSFFVDNGFSFTQNIPRIFLLNCVGVISSHLGGMDCVMSWFVSVLFWASILYFYIAKVFDEKYRNLIIALMVFFCADVAFRMNHFSLYGVEKTRYLIFNSACLRGLMGIGIGYFVNMLHKTDFMRKVSCCGNVWISLMEVCTCVYILYNLFFVKYMSGGTMFNTVLAFTILFFCLLKKRGILSRIFENDFSVFLGASSYAIFIVHPFLKTVCRLVIVPQYHSFVGKNNVLVFFLAVMLSIIVGFLVHYLFEKPINKLIKNKLFSKE